MLKMWERKKILFFKIKVESDFNKIDGEKIVIPMSPAVIYNQSPTSSGFFIRDIIVTNKRILIGFLVSFIFINTEKFGNLNFWYDKQTDIKKDNLLKILGSDSVIKEISYHQDKQRGDYIIIKPDFLKLPIYYKIFHKDAKKIYDLAQKNK